LDHDIQLSFSINSAKIENEAPTVEPVLVVLGANDVKPVGDTDDLPPRNHTSCWVSRKLIVFMVASILLGVITICILLATEVFDSEDNAMESSYDGRDGIDSEEMQNYHSVTIHWQSLGTGYGHSLLLDYISDPAFAQVGEPTSDSNGDVVFTLKEMEAADDSAIVDVTVTVECCTKTWLDVEATVDSGWGSWSSLATCECENATFDHQVRVKVNSSPVPEG
jgi:hypothetical protein